MNTVTGLVGTVGSAVGVPGVGGSCAATPTAGCYQPPLNDAGNPHGEGTVATATVGAGVLPGVGRQTLGTGGLNNEIVVGRSIGEYQALTTKQFHGHITVLSLFGSEIFGVDSTPGQTNNGILGNGLSAIGKLCSDTANTICLNVTKATSATTNVSSINHFETAGIGIAGITADVAYSDGNITVDPISGCETTFGDSHLGTAAVGVLPVANAIDSQSGGTACNDPKSTKNAAPTSLSQVVGLVGSPLGIPIVAPNPGCSSGGPPSTFQTGASGTTNVDVGIPLLLPVICNADDTQNPPSGPSADPNGPTQDRIPYTVREALTAFALQLTPATAVAKVTLGASQASVTAPGTIGTTTTPATTTPATTTPATTTPATTTPAPTTPATTTPATTTPATTTPAPTTPATTTPATTTPATTTPATTTPATTTPATTTPATTGTAPATPVKASTLPFTGLNVLWLLLGGVAMLTVGTTLRRFGRRGPAE